MVKCLAQGHKRCDRPGRDLNPPELESNALDRSATTLHVHTVQRNLPMFMVHARLARLVRLVRLSVSLS